MWWISHRAIRLVPRGTYNMRDKFMLSLKMLPYYVHHEIFGMLVRIVFECPQLNIAWNDVCSFNRKGGNYSCKFDISHVLKWDDFYNFQHILEPISFEFKVKVLKLCGAG
eukprot:389006_1